ncbi:MAG: xanthine dehydrogenase family protein molybdopterin-binding subunit [Xanthobacteraceae bacterium]
MGAKMMGARVPRLEDPRLLRGQASFVDDLRLPGILHAAVLRSPHAHARIRKVDLSAVRAAPGVVDAFCLGDIWQNPPTIPVVVGVPSLLPCAQYPLAREVVRYVGEPVAIVVASDRARAEEALEAAAVEYDPLPVLSDANTARAPGAPSLHATAPGNVAARWTQGFGDVKAAFEHADYVVRDHLRMQRYTGVPLETRGILASPDPVSGELTIWTSGQWPHTARRITAAMLGMEEQRIRCILPDVGGGFGVKCDIYPEDILIPLAATRLNRPVKWIEDRREHFLGSVHAREMTFDLELALKADGTILGMRGQIISDQGAYVRTLGIVNASLAITGLPGPYNIKSYFAEVICPLTNKSPTSTYRGAGAPEGTYARERLLDIASHQLGIDPAELRLKNLLPPEALPYNTGLVNVEAAVCYDSGDFPAALRQALAKADYIDFRKAQLRARSEGRLRGVGICVYVQQAAIGPYEGAEVRVEGNGNVSVVSGAAPQGQGSATALAQIVADELDVPLERVSVGFGDTARIPFGVGTYASRNAVMAGSAAYGAAQRVRDKAIQVAAHLFEASPADVEWKDGVARIVGVPDEGYTLAELAQAARPGGNRPSGTEPGLEARYYFEKKQSPFSYGVHVAEVDIDRETGDVKLSRYVVVNDCGRMINPMIVEGQIAGGIAQGAGGALLEELVYDEQGQLLTASLLDYPLPTSLDLPPIEISHLVSPSNLNPLGVKGVGEGGAIGAHAAVTNAVADAIAHTGARVRETPLRPAVVWKLLKETSVQSA